MIDWREGMQSAINSPLGSKHVTRTTESELLHFWISGASSIFLWLPERSPALERLPRWCGVGGWGVGEGHHPHTSLTDSVCFSMTQKASKLSVS